MTIYHPPASHSNFITRSPCPKCSTTMLLASIEPDGADHDRRTFECLECGHSESVVVKFK
jgi:Zn ribbon nucleic-acid-binding protein